MKKFLLLVMFVFLSACSTDNVLSDDSVVLDVVEEVEVIVVDSEEEPKEVELSYPYDVELVSNSLGKIGVISISMDLNRTYKFLEGLNSKVYNRYDLFDEANYDTILVLYQGNLLDFYHPSIWGVSSIQIGQVLIRTVRERKVIMAHFESFDVATRLLPQLDQRIFTIQEDSTLDEFFEWQAMNPMPEKEVIKTPVILSDESRLQPIDVCRLRQTKVYPNESPHSRGFPLKYNVVPTKGIVNVAFLALDFPDVQGDPALIQQWLDEIYTIEAWSQFLASGIMEYRVHFEPKWITTPKDAKWYGCESCMRIIEANNYDEPLSDRLQPEMEAINQVFTAADEYYDWANMDFAHMAFPTRAEADPYWVRLYSHGGNNSTPRAGNVFVPVFGGYIGWMAPDFTDYTFWDFMAHEILHEQGLVGHGPYNGANYSIMQNQHGYSKMLLSWEVFLLDWWNEDHLACIEFDDLDEPFVFEIDSLDQNGILTEGAKNLMIRLNNEEIIVIEYRTNGPFSDLPKELHGVTAYIVNVNKPNYRCDIGCEDLSLEERESRNYWRYLKDYNNTQPCVLGDFHPVYGYQQQRFCNQPAFVHQPGAVIYFEDIVITVLEDNVVEVKRSVA